MNWGAVVAVTLGLVGCSRRDASSTRIDPASTPSAPRAIPEAASASPAPVAVSDASTAKPFGALCVTDADCGASVCFHRRIKGADAGHERRDSGEAVEHDGYCSIRCDDDADCPVPPTKGKCGARGMCKRPE